MKRILIFHFFIFTFLHLLAQRSVENMNFQWQFAYDSLFTNAKTIDVPHDFQIEQPWVAPSADEKADNTDVAANIKSRLSARGFKEMGTGWYRKTITHTPTSNTRYLLDFEGIMLTGDVYLNGQHIGGTDYGYVGFEIDVTNLLRKGENILVVKASTQNEKASRWYTGGGLFRNVSLVSTPADIYFERHPLYITTRDNRYVTVSADYTNRTRMKQTRMKVSIYDAEGNLVAETTAQRGRNPQSRTVNIKAQEQERVSYMTYEMKIREAHDDGNDHDEDGEHSVLCHQERLGALLNLQGNVVHLVGTRILLKDPATQIARNANANCCANRGHPCYCSSHAIPPCTRFTFSCCLRTGHVSTKPTRLPNSKVISSGNR